MIINPEVGDKTSYAYVMYKVEEYNGPRRCACENCDLPAGVCDGPMPIGCHPEQRHDGKQVVFKKRYTIKKRNRNIQNTHKL